MHSLSPLFRVFVMSAVFGSLALPATTASADLANSSRSMTMNAAQGSIRARLGSLANRATTAVRAVRDTSARMRRSTVDRVRAAAGRSRETVIAARQGSADALRAVARGGSAIGTRAWRASVRRTISGMRAVRNGTIGASDARLQADELHDQVREGAWADHDQIEQEVREIDTAERSETRAAAAERRQANRVVRNAARVVRRQARDRAIAIRRLRRDGDAGESQIQNLMDYGVEEQDAADAVFASSPRFATWSEDARISETRTRRGSPPGPGVWDSDPAGDENEPSIDDSPSESTQDPIAAGPEPVSVTATQGRLIEGAPQRPLLAAGSSDSSLTPVRLGARAVMMRPAIARVSTGTAVFRERVATRVGQAFNHLRFQSHRGSNIRIVVRPDSSPGSYTLLSPDLSSSELAEIQRGIANGAAGSDGFRPAVAINTVFATAPNARGAVVTLRIGRTGSVERASYEARE